MLLPALAAAAHADPRAVVGRRAVARHPECRLSPPLRQGPWGSESLAPRFRALARQHAPRSETGLFDSIDGRSLDRHVRAADERRHPRRRRLRQGSRRDSRRRRRRRADERGGHAAARQLPRAATVREALAHELGAAQGPRSSPWTSAIRTHSPGATMARASSSLTVDDVAEFEVLIGTLESNHAADFRTRFIAESPAKLRRLRDYFAALLGLGAFPPVRCNAPEFSPSSAPTGELAPCFHSGTCPAPRAPELIASLASDPARALRAAIRAGERHECAKRAARCGAIRQCSQTKGFDSGSPPRSTHRYRRCSSSTGRTESVGSRESCSGLRTGSRASIGTTASGSSACSTCASS